MKKTFKVIRRIAGITALLLVIGFSMGACDLDDDGGGGPSSVDAGALTIGTWSTERSLPNKNSEVWYTFSVTSGTTYYVWVRDYWSSSVVVADGYADVLTSAKYGSKTGTAIFTASDRGAGNSTDPLSGGSSPQSLVASNFTATQAGTVYLRVYPDPSLNVTGKFRVAVTTSNSRPSGETGSSTPAAQKSITVTGLTSYNSNYAILSLSNSTDTVAYTYGSISGGSFTGSLDDWDTDEPWNGSGNYSITFMIYPNQTAVTNKWAPIWTGGTTSTAVTNTSTTVAFSTLTSIPVLPSLTSGTWSSEGTLANASSEEWYTINVTSGTTYYVWVKEYWSNSVVVADGYADVLTSARYGSKTGTLIFENSDAGANTSTAAGGTPPNNYPASNFTATQTGTVYLRVHPYTGLLATYGKFRVAFTTTNTRPSGE
jgi:hypothetical protein